ncbi:NAD(P)-dependent oxidoreductase [Actinomadura fulvescens]|uniref:NAD-dependent epimerase/dehydratase family protein n=1 Tax=Actinomadura fulvescens TaxID=46160 RepID=UPI00397CCCA4
MRVLVAGASGVLGRHMVKALKAAGHDVVGLGRTPGGGRHVRELGAGWLAADLLDERALLAAVDGTGLDAVIHAATALRKAPVRYRDMDATNALRTQGTANLLKAARAAGATRFVVETMVPGYGFGDWGDHVITEDDTPYGPTGRNRALEAIIAGMRSKEEQAFAADGIEGVALRYGFLYGEGFGVGGTDAFVTMLNKRRLPVANGGVVPWTDLADAASAAVAALERAPAGAAYNIVDNEAAGVSEYTRYLVKAFGTPRPPKVPLWALRPIPYLHAMLKTTMRVSNAKAARELGWKPAYPTYRDGVTALADHRRRPDPALDLRRRPTSW